jgi:preprotein translocase subunit SecE
MSKITEYLRETKGELRHVNWPTRKQAAVFTALVIAISLITAAYLGVFDYLFSRLLQLVI